MAGRVKEPALMNTMFAGVMRFGVLILKVCTVVRLEDAGIMRASQRLTLAETEHLIPAVTCLSHRLTPAGTFLVEAEQLVLVGHDVWLSF